MTTATRSPAWRTLPWASTGYGGPLLRRPWGARHDAFHDVVIPGAAAQIAFEALAHFLLRGVRMDLREVERVHHHARGAEAALKAVVFLKRRLHRMQGSVGMGDAFDGQDVGAFRLHRDDR